MMNHVVFLGAGGTIAGTASSATDNVGYQAGQLGIAQLLQGSPALAGALNGYVPEAEQVLQLDSKDMAFADWQHLLARVLHHLARPEVATVLITHGTDTLEETAYFLHRAIPKALCAGKAVVFTCAMRPASSSHADGPANLADAAAVAVSPLRSGVMVVCAGMVYAAAQVQKVHPYRLNPFDGGDAGPIGYVEEGVFRRVATELESEGGCPAPALAQLLEGSCPRVEIVMSHAGASGDLVRALLSDTQHGGNPVRGIVVAATGNGTIHAALQHALEQAEKAGVWVWRSTRCAYGRVVTGKEQGAPGLPIAYASAVKARIDMIVALAHPAAAGPRSAL